MSCTSSNLCDDLLLQLMCISAYCNNFYLLSTYVFECMIDFVCGNLYLIYMKTHVYNRFYFVATFILRVWKFLFYDNLYIITQVVTYE